MNHSTPHNEKSSPAGSAIGHLTELVCLQGRLLIADLKEGAESARLAATLGVLGLTLLIAAAPTLLIALAFYLRDSLGYAMATSLLISALAGAAVGLLLAAAAWRAGRTGAKTAVRSYDDFEENVRSLTRSL